MAYHRKLGLDVRIARIFNTYGPGMSPTDGRRDHALHCECFEGPGSVDLRDRRDQTRSFCYIDDEIKGLLALLDSDHVGPVNIGGTTEITIRDLAEMVSEVTGSSSPLVYEPLPTDDPPSAKARYEIGSSSLSGWETQRRSSLRACVHHGIHARGVVNVKPKECHRQSEMPAPEWAVWADSENSGGWTSDSSPLSRPGPQPRSRLFRQHRRVRHVRHVAPSPLLCKRI